jgi:gliding motility-associated-like protein
MFASITNKKNIVILSLALLICSLSSRAQVVINEVLHYPTTAQGLISTGTEYIELYNAGCSPIDISCYILGTAAAPNANPGSTLRTGGSIIFPQGTVIQPKSHFVIGTSSSSSDPLAVDFKTDLNTNSYCNTGNFVLANGDGWVALYDAAGTPVDAIYWTVAAGQANKISTDDDLDDNPCVPSSLGTCNTSGISTLLSAKQIFESTPSLINYVGQANISGTAPTGKTFSRIADGGTWQRDIDRSISGNNCNGGTCDAQTVPTFEPIGPLCLNSTAPALPLTSSNGIDGTWNPTTIATSTVGTSTYTFTPASGGACAAAPVTINIEITSSVTPTFDPKGPFCKDAILTQPILPETSNNGIQGTWNPASLSTAVAGNIVYTFTPTNTPGQCATTTTLTVLVENNNASATLESDPGTDNQTVTANSPIKPIKYGFFPAAGTPGATINVTGLPDGVTFSFPVPGASSLSISGSPTSTVGSPFTYTLTVKGNCEPITITGTITVLEPAPKNSFSFSCAKDTIIECVSSCITLKATIPDIRSSTSSYEINPIAPAGSCYPVSAIPNTPGTPVDLKIDDDYSGVVNLPFSFPFFDDAGSPYNSVIVSPNGYLSFDATKANTESHYGILNDGFGLSGLNGTEEDMPSTLYDRSLIMSAYQDIDLSASNSPNKRIKYEVVGTAPHRKFVVTYFKAPLFYDPFFNPSCPNLIENTHQIVLYEGTGVVEVIINSLESCPDWNNGKTMTGLQNFNRDKAVLPPGRKASDPSWGSINMNESWRFVPSAGPTLYRSVELYDLAGNLVATGDTTRINSSTFEVSFPNVCPNGNATYVVKSKYEQINNPGSFVFGTDTINVISKDGLTVSTRKDTTICIGASVTLESSSNGDTYSWSGSGLDNASLLSPVATPTNVGVNTYTLSSTKNGCTKTASVNVTAESSVQINAGADQSILSGQSAQLNATASGADTYLWTSSPEGTTLSSTTISNPVATPTATTTYTLTASNAAGCKASDDVTVTVVSYCIKVENAFTPNGDGINDLWKVYGSYDCLSNVKVNVFNRYGSKVYESKDYRNFWDGRYNGKPVPDGTYYAVIEFKLISGKTIVTRTDLTVLR